MRISDWSSDVCSSDLDRPHLPLKNQENFMSNREAVIVSTARTPIGKAYRGAFNATPSPTLAAHAIRAAVERAQVDPGEIDDVIMGAALQQGVQATIGDRKSTRLNSSH